MLPEWFSNVKRITTNVSFSWEGLCYEMNVAVNPGLKQAGMASWGCLCTLQAVSLAPWTQKSVSPRVLRCGLREYPLECCMPGGAPGLPTLLWPQSPPKAPQKNDFQGHMELVRHKPRLYSIHLAGHCALTMEEQSGRVEWQQGPEQRCGLLPGNDLH